MRPTLPDLRQVPTEQLETWLRRNELPLRDMRLIEQEYTTRMTRELIAEAKTVHRFPEGWYDDAHRPGMQRWWDGTNWTDRCRSTPRS